MSIRLGSKVRWLAPAMLLFAFLVFTAPPAQACMSCYCTPYYCWCEANLGMEEEAVEVTFLSAERVVLKVPGYETTDLEDGQECVVAVPELPGMQSIRDLVNFDSDTEFPLEVVSFTSSDLPGREIARVAESKGFDAGNHLPWRSFVSTSSGDLEDGVPNHFVLEIQLEPGTDPYAFVEELRSHGALITASSDADGNPDGGHTYLKPFSNFPMKVTMHPTADTIQTPHGH